MHGGKKEEIKMSNSGYILVTFNLKSQIVQRNHNVKTKIQHLILNSQKTNGNDLELLGCHSNT